MSASSSGPTRRNVLATVQILRGLAALLVVVGHTLLETSHLKGVSGRPLPIPHYGFGVDVFFVLSGFIMMYTSGSAFGSSRSGARFMVARILRIAPLYWTLLVVMLVILSVVPSAFSQPFPTITQTLGSVFFVPVRAAGGEILPLLTVGWTLNYEMFFYLAFALSLTRSRNVGVIAMLAFLAGLAVLGSIANPHAAIPDFWTDSIVVEFGFGILVGLAAPRLLRLQRAAAITFIAVGVGAYIVGHSVEFPFNNVRFLALGVPALLIVAGAVSLDLRGTPLRNRAIERLGDASYSLYLSHLFVVRLIRVSWNAAGVSSPSIVYVFITVVASIGCAILLATLFELPLQRYTKRRTSGFLQPSSPSFARK